MSVLGLAQMSERMDSIKRAIGLGWEHDPEWIAVVLCTQQLSMARKQFFDSHHDFYFFLLLLFIFTLKTNNSRQLD